MSSNSEVVVTESVAKGSYRAVTFSFDVLNVVWHMLALST